ncbi:hypothetical protein OK348_16165 [Flavobacterium sp. MXW15]|uniref:DUF4410 domain-containing protein n=1 Tax=Xanthomonas chitinilytica TaxID=2989819 RepID=A0ABT3JZW9_9XANT|nr:hypothetical protein [Xanthomonas sp. H13-6]MCW4456320.1 hypothetical protein [Flavobacterium sp. MXW15]MCW4474026.1 hypothetical protein [Xanthomonas sp. H13-6]
MRHSMRAAVAALLCCALPSMAAEIHAQDPVPYSESSIIAENIKAECRIGTQLASSLGRNAPAHGNTIVFGTEPDADANGRVLKLELVEAQSAGNAFMGHFKSAAVRGVLLQDGQQVATVTARRISRGGAFAGFKGSCDVLERTVNAIGSDLAAWLGNPVDGARLGDI